MLEKDCNDISICTFPPCHAFQMVWPLDWFSLYVALSVIWKKSLKQLWLLYCAVQCSAMTEQWQLRQASLPSGDCASRALNLSAQMWGPYIQCLLYKCLLGYKPCIYRTCSNSLFYVPIGMSPSLVVTLLFVTFVICQTWHYIVITFKLYLKFTRSSRCKRCCVYTCIAF